MSTTRRSAFAMGAALTLSLLASAAFGGNITFSPVPAPITDGKKRAVLSSQTVRVNGSTYPSGRDDEYGYVGYFSFPALQ